MNNLEHDEKKNDNGDLDAKIIESFGEELGRPLLSLTDDEKRAILKFIYQ